MSGKVNVTADYLSRSNGGISEEGGKCDGPEWWPHKSGNVDVSSLTHTTCIYTYSHPCTYIHMYTLYEGHIQSFKVKLYLISFVIRIHFGLVYNNHMKQTIFISSLLLGFHMFTFTTHLYIHRADLECTQISCVVSVTYICFYF